MTFRLGIFYNRFGLKGREDASVVAESIVALKVITGENMLTILIAIRSRSALLAVVEGNTRVHGATLALRAFCTRDVLVLSAICAVSASCTLLARGCRVCTVDVRVVTKSAQLT